VVAQKTPLRSIRVSNFCWLHSANGKRKKIYFYKNKGYRYEDELGLKKLVTFPGNGARKFVGISLTHTERFYKHTSDRTT
jgi:hypothetical protein